jgi:hypothetical protein
MREYILKIAASILGLGGVIVYLGRLIINRSIDLGIEQFKSNLNEKLETHKSELLRKTEEYKANLQLVSMEHQIRYSKLHEERGESIRELFQLLVELQKKLEYFTSRFQGPEWKSDKDREVSARKAHEDLDNYFDLNRIYYPAAICTKLDEIIDSSWKIIVDMSVSKVSEDRKLWFETNNKVSDDLRQARLLLQNEFKKLLGVE